MVYNIGVVLWFVLWVKGIVMFYNVYGLIEIFRNYILDVRVVFLGYGVDEVFGGYRRYRIVFE